MIYSIIAIIIYRSLIITNTKQTTMDTTENEPWFRIYKNPGNKTDLKTRALEIYKSRKWWSSECYRQLKIVFANRIINSCDGSETCIFITDSADIKAYEFNKDGKLRDGYAYYLDYQLTDSDMEFIKSYAHKPILFQNIYIFEGIIQHMKHINKQIKNDNRLIYY